MSEEFLFIDRSTYDRISNKIREDLKSRKLEFMAEFEKEQRLEKERLYKSLGMQIETQKNEDQSASTKDKEKIATQTGETIKTPKIDT